MSLNIAGLKVVRSGRCILDIDSLDVGAGQFVNIIGTNGAGKTTLLKVLVGLIGPSSGSVMFDNVSMSSLSPWNRTNLKKQIGYIPQSAEYNSNLPFTVREIVSMGVTSSRPLFYRFTEKDNSAIDGWIDRVNLTSQRHQTFRSLSGGEQQKVLIARAMVQNPRLLLLDEPTSNLDFHWKARIRRLVTDLHRQLNLTVLMISHELSSVPIEDLRAVLLDGGRIIADGTTEQVLTCEKIRGVYKCDFEIHRIDDRRYIINRGIFDE